jgi:hypothetical protein
MNTFVNFLSSVEKERKKAEKQAKFDQKKAKAATAAPAATSKTKEKKAKADKDAEKEVLPPYVEETPFGEKKSKTVTSTKPPMEYTNNLRSH